MRWARRLSPTVRAYFYVHGHSRTCDGVYDPTQCMLEVPGFVTCVVRGGEAVGVISKDTELAKVRSVKFSSKLEKGKRCGWRPQRGLSSRLGWYTGVGWVHADR